MSIQIITLEEPKKWDEIVKSFQEYDVFYLSGYAKAFQLHDDGEPCLFYYNDHNVKAMKVILQRDVAFCEGLENKIPQRTFFDLTTPYGYGGFWIEGEDNGESEKAFDHYCKEKGYVCEFVRFHLFAKSLDQFNGEVEGRLKNVVRTLDLDLDQMLYDFEHKVRKNIKRAISSGLKIEFDSDGSRLKEFLNIYYKTMDRNEAKSSYYFSEDFFHAINQLNGHYCYFYIIYEEKVISTELILYGTQHCYSFLGGTLSDYFSLRPNDYLKYEIIKWAKGKGLKTFILGGGYKEDDGIFHYKKSFAPTGLHRFYIGKKVFDQERYDKLVALRNLDTNFNPNTEFFPIYRA